MSFRGFFLGCLVVAAVAISALPAASAAHCTVGTYGRVTYCVNLGEECDRETRDAADDCGNLGEWRIDYCVNEWSVSPKAALLLDDADFHYDPDPAVVCQLGVLVDDETVPLPPVSGFH